VQATSLKISRAEQDYLFKNTGQLLLRRTYSVVLPRTISMMRLWP
jgi:hypothetical protein